MSTNLCDRCLGEVMFTTMSLFNTDMCCQNCIEIERQHPQFPEARKRELEELQAGNYNFPGIGLPETLKSRGST